MKTIDEIIKGFILTHEGGLSVDPRDNGNWTGGKKGVGTLVGSKYGTTAAAVATYRGVPVSSITAKDIANLKIEEAVNIGVKSYYKTPRFDLLPMNRVTASVVDKGWGSGPKQAIKLLQRMVGVKGDGILGPATAKAYAEYITKTGEEQAARNWALVRRKFDASLGQPVYLKGWNNRTDSFLPGTKWWKEW